MELPEKMEEVQVPEKRKTDTPEDGSKAKKVKLDGNDSRTKRPGFSDERYDETSYYFENGMTIARQIYQII